MSNQVLQKSEHCPRCQAVTVHELTFVGGVTIKTCVDCERHDFQ